MFIELLFGHLVGDYLLQTKEMSLNKTKKGHVGFHNCFWHCMIYSLFVSLFLFPYFIINKNFVSGNGYLIFSGIFLIHWIIDRYSLASKWLKFIKGRTLESTFESQDYPFREYDVAFTCIVYTVVDNTFHLLLSFILLKFLI